MDILVITSRHELWQTLKPRFEARGAVLRVAETLEDARKDLQTSKASLVILDIGSDRAAIRNAVFQILSVDAMIHTAAAVAMNPEEFHDAMEGLGMLGSLPERPAAEDVDKLLDALTALSA
ncbi:hypothetical protein [Mailhella sp.]|uniref:hypothetical protein n=1 Tax=Mailhella sp. TaxID=1981029 RepID=UPI003AB1979A